MAFVLQDRVKETTATTGTGTFTLDGTSTGFVPFSVIGNGNETYYTAVDNTTGDWEVGIGTYNTGTLTRDTVLASSNSGNKVPFVAGAKDIFVAYPAEKAVTLDTAQTLSNKTLSAANLGTPTAGVLTNATGLPLTTGVTGTLPIANGGTAVTSAPFSGQLLIGNGTGYTLATLTAGTGVTITNAPGSITINAPEVGTVTAVTASAPLASSGGNTPDISLTGVVSVQNGGTGVATLTGYVKASGTAAFTAVAQIPAGDVSGLGTMATQNANSVSITGGSINGTTVGLSTPSTGAFTTVSAASGFFGNLTGDVTGNVSGNAGTVTNGVYTTGSYSDPSWITSLAGSKISGNISGNAANVTGTVAVTNGGTGVTTLTGYVKASGTAAFTAVAQVPASDISGLGTMATQNANNVAITGGSINGTTIGGSTPAAGTFTTLNATGLSAASANAAVALITTGTITNLTATGASVASANVGVALVTTGTVTNLTATSASVASANLGTAVITTGNLAFSSTAQRITGDMSNATIANRLAFQTSTANSATIVGVLPSGTGTEGRVTILNNSDPTASSGLDLRSLTTEAQIRANNYGGGALPMTFLTGGSERVRIDTSGNVGIGTASPAAKLQSAGTSGSAQFRAGTASNGYFEINAFDSNPVYCVVGGSNATAGVFGTQSNTPTIFFSNNTERMRITEGGEVYIAGTTDQGAYNLQCNGTGVWGAGAYVNGSDARLKDNIATLNDGLNVVNQLRPVTFKYKPDYSKDQNVQTGFIAQELQTALEGKDYLDGIVQAGPNHLNVAYQSLIPILVKAIQELSARVAELEAK